MDFLLIICAHQLPAFCVTNSIERLNQEDPQLITQSLDLARKTLCSSNKSAAGESHIVIATSHYSFPNLLTPKLYQWCHHLDSFHRWEHLWRLTAQQNYIVNMKVKWDLILSTKHYFKWPMAFTWIPFQINYDITRSNTPCNSNKYDEIFIILVEQIQNVNIFN